MRIYIWTSDRGEPVYISRRKPKPLRGEWVGDCDVVSRWIASRVARPAALPRSGVLVTIDAPPIGGISITRRKASEAR